MRTLDPGPGQKAQWSKECRCTGAGNGDQGCGSLLLVEWEDLFLTCGLGDPRDYIYSLRTPKSADELLQWADEAFRRGVRPLDLCDKHEMPICVTFRCHDCKTETDLLTMDPLEIGQRGFHLLPTKREWDMRMEKFRKD